MNSKSKLDKIDFNIENGLKLKATIQLRSIIDKNPNNLEVWDKLAQLYYDAGFFDAAGRFWIFNESDEKHIRDCVEIYEKSVSFSGNQILNDIKFRGDKSNLNQYAKAKLTELEDRSKLETGNIPIFKSENNVKPSVGKWDPLKQKIVQLIFLIVLIFILISTIVGLYHIYRWIFS